jgi:hypothetical protein
VLLESRDVGEGFEHGERARGSRGWEALTKGLGTGQHVIPFRSRRSLRRGAVFLVWLGKFPPNVVE